MLQRRLSRFSAPALSGCSTRTSLCCAVQCTQLRFKSKTTVSDEERAEFSWMERMNESRSRCEVRNFKPNFVTNSRTFAALAYEKYSKRVPLREYSKRGRAIGFRDFGAVMAKHLANGSDKLDASDLDSDELSTRKQAFACEKLAAELELKREHKTMFDPRSEVVVRCYSSALSIYDWTGVASVKNMRIRENYTGNLLPPKSNEESDSDTEDDSGSAKEKSKAAAKKSKKAKVSESEFAEKYVENRPFGSNGIVGRAFAGVIEHIPEELKQRVKGKAGFGLVSSACFPFKEGDRVYGLVSEHAMADYIPIHWASVHRVPDHVPLHLAGCFPMSYELALDCAKVSRVRMEQLSDCDVLVLGTGNGSLMTTLFPMLLHSGIRSLTVVLSHERHRPYVDELIRLFDNDNDGDLSGCFAMEIDVVNFDDYLEEFLAIKDSSTRRKKKKQKSGGKRTPFGKVNPESALNPFGRDPMEDTEASRAVHGDSDSNAFRVFDLVVDSVAFETEEMLSHLQFVRPQTGAYWICQTMAHENELYSLSRIASAKKDVHWYKRVLKEARQNFHVRKVGPIKLPPHKMLSRGGLFGKKLLEPVLLADGNYDLEARSFPVPVDRVYTADEAVAKGAFEYFHNSDPYHLHENVVVQFKEEKEFDAKALEKATGMKPCFPVLLQQSQQKPAISEVDKKKELKKERKAKKLHSSKPT